jgi:hypothetical protein
MHTYIDTSGALARQSRVAVPTIVKYAEAGWLDYIVASDGTRLFRAGQADRVREIFERRMANRGRKPRRPAVA